MYLNFSSIKQHTVWHTHANKLRLTSLLLISLMLAGEGFLSAVTLQDQKWSRGTSRPRPKVSNTVYLPLAIQTYHKIYKIIFHKWTCTQSTDLGQWRFGLVVTALVTQDPVCNFHWSVSLLSVSFNALKLLSGDRIEPSQTWSNFAKESQLNKNWKQIVHAFRNTMVH